MKRSVTSPIDLYFPVGNWINCKKHRSLNNARADLIESFKKRCDITNLVFLHKDDFMMGDEDDESLE